MHDWISDVNVWLYGIASSLAGAVVVLVRKVYTNEKQIQLLQAEITTREEYRKEKDEEIKEQLTEMRNDIKSLLSK
jgi:membrane protein involved in colicin uptake